MHMQVRHINNITENDPSAESCFIKDMLLKFMFSKDFVYNAGRY